MPTAPLPAPHRDAPRGRSTWEVFRIFLRLGLTSFGGPVAHLGFFRTEFVERRAWLTDAEYADLVALCQFLPGPASSQVGFAIGLARTGFRGALAAFFAFTLPSALLMVAFAAGAARFSGGTIGDGLIAGLQVAAVAIIAHAVLGMSRTLTPDRTRAGIALIGAAIVLLFAGPFGQVTALAVGAIAGWIWCRHLPTPASTAVAMLRFPVRALTGWIAAALVVILLLGGPILTALSGSESLTVFEAFFRSGALVFGGGHVVLPLLDAATVESGWITEAAFLTGYGAAQALPGPLFSFAAYLGFLSEMGPGGLAGAGLALTGIFLPGFLLLIAVLPFWNALRTIRTVQAVMHGMNAAVVGILAAALATPVISSTIVSGASLVLAGLCFLLLVSWKSPPWVVVIVGAVGGAVGAAVGIR